VNVRGWLIIGSDTAGYGLPPERNRGTAFGNIPDASEHEPGDWCRWHASDDRFVTIVCVEVPLG